MHIGEVQVERLFCFEADLYVLTLQLTEDVSVCPGQYALIALEGNVYKPYSIYSINGLRSLSFLLKLSAAGGRAQYFLEKCSAQNSVKMKLPLGGSVLSNSVESTCIVAQGSAISPVCSMLGQLKCKMLSQQQTLFWYVNCQKYPKLISDFKMGIDKVDSFSLILMDCQVFSAAHFKQSLYTLFEERGFEECLSFGSLSFVETVFDVASKNQCDFKSDYRLLKRTDML